MGSICLGGCGDVQGWAAPGICNEFLYRGAQAWQGKARSPPTTVSGLDGTLAGTVVFTTGPTTLRTVTLSAATGTASCSATNAPGGADTITGTYSGDFTYAVSAGSATLNVGSTAAGPAYYETVSDGGVFAFDAPFYMVDGPAVPEQARGWHGCCHIAQASDSVLAWPLAFRENGHGTEILSQRMAKVET